MAESSWPFHDGVDGTPVLEDQWSYMARQWAATGVVGAPGDANLQVFANSSGREVHVRAGRASVRGHWFLSDAQETLAIAANASGNPRIDRVVVQLDPSSDEATLAVLTGTPAGSPSAPTLTQTDTGVYELVLAQVAVANGAASISSGNVTDERTFTSVPYTPALSSLRPTSPVAGQRIWESDTGLSKVWNGSAWVNDQQALFDALGVYSDWTPQVFQGVSAIPVTVSRARYTQIGKHVAGYAKLVIQGNGTAGNAVTMTVPVPAVTWGGGGSWWHYDTGLTNRTGHCEVISSAGMQFYRTNDGTAYGVSPLPSPLLPYEGSAPTLSVGDIFSVSFAYQAS